MKIPSSIFKAYDIRGIVETELTPEIVKLIGRAVGSESIEKGESCRWKGWEINGPRTF